MPEELKNLKGNEKVYVTRNALTKGILETTILKVPREGCDLISVGKDPYSYHRLGDDLFLTLEEAKKKAEKMRLSKIKSHKKSIAKLEKLKFD